MINVLFNNMKLFVGIALATHATTSDIITVTINNSSSTMISGCIIDKLTMIQGYIRA